MVTTSAPAPTRPTLSAPAAGSGTRGATPPWVPAEYETLRVTVEDFARQVVAPVAARHDAEGSFPYDVVRQMGELGLFGLPFPEDVGGQGADYLALCMAIEELARVDSSVAITLEAGVSLGAMPVHRFGTAEQRERWLPQLCSGRSLAAFGLTEPDAGSDAGGTRTRARLDGDEHTGEWVVDGAKAFITNSGTDITRLVTVTAVTGTRPDGSPEISAIMIPTPAAGFTASAPYSKVGWHASDTHGLTLDGVRVPAANLLGARGRGYAQFLSTLDEGRVAIAALATGLAQGCVDEAVRYAGERTSGGRPIGTRQAVAFTIADMAARAHTARMAWLDAAGRMVRGLPFRREAWIAKLHASTVAVDNARAATQIFGGNGFMNEYPVARHWRDAKVLEIGEGTSEVMRMLVARDMGLPVDW